MKVILQRSVDSLGDPGDVVTVKGGYARNFLFPKGLAVPASKGATRHAESLKASHDASLVKMKGSAETAATSLVERNVEIKAPASEDGKLFGSVTATDIANAVGGIVGGEVVVSKRSVLLEAPIKAVGEHSVKVKLHPDVVTEIIVEVVPA